MSDFKFSKLNVLKGFCESGLHLCGSGKGSVSEFTGDVINL
jgi:hypothetical protein